MPKTARGLWTIVALATITGCAHSEYIKTASKEQQALLGSFQTALDDVRTRVRTALNESIDAYRQAWTRRWVTTETNALSTRLLDCSPNPSACGAPSVRRLLDEAGVYLAAGKSTLFGSFCAPGGTWETMKRSWMKSQGEACFDSPRKTAERLGQIRDQLDEHLRRLGQDLVDVQQAHAIIDKFLQIRIEVRAEDVDAARKTIGKATAAVQDVETAVQALRKEAVR